MLWQARRPPDQITLSRGTCRTLWIVAALDVVVAAWMIAAGSWLDQASKLTAAVTLDGRHQLVMGLALIGFAMLAALGVVTNGYASASRLQLALIAIGSAISVFALAGVLLGILLLVIGAVLLGLLARFFMRR